MSEDKTSLMTIEYEYSPDEVLNFIRSQGNIDLDEVAHQMRKKDIEETLKDVHKYSITQLKDGRWKTHVKDPSKKEGRRVIVKRSLDDLEEALYEYYTVDVHENPMLKRKHATLRSLYPEWLEYRRLHTTAETTLIRFESVWRTHYIGNEIIDIPIRKLDFLTLDVWAHKFLKEEKPTKTAYYNRTGLLNQMLKYSVACGIIESNPFDKVKVDPKMFSEPQHKDSSEQVFTDAEVAAITELAWEDFRNKHNPKHQLTPLAVIFELQIGSRAGEALALRYEDIEGYTLWVQRMSRDATKEVVDHTKHGAPPRPLPLTDTAIEIIEAAKQRQIEEGVNSNGYIFSMTDDPLPYECLKDAYTRYCKLIDTPHKSSHCARKTVISKLFDAGVNIATIQELAGHKDKRTTLNSYVFDRSKPDEKRELIQNALQYGNA